MAPLLGRLTGPTQTLRGCESGAGGTGLQEPSPSMTVGSCQDGRWQCSPPGHASPPGPLRSPPCPPTLPWRQLRHGPWCGRAHLASLNMRLEPSLVCGDGLWWQGLDRSCTCGHSHGWRLSFPHTIDPLGWGQHAFQRWSFGHRRTVRVPMGRFGIAELWESAVWGETVHILPLLPV